MAACAPADDRSDTQVEVDDAAAPAFTQVDARGAPPDVVAAPTDVQGHVVTDSGPVAPDAARHADATNDTRPAEHTPPVQPTADAGPCQGPVPNGGEPAGTCGFSACGGDPVGEWTLVAWCEKSYAPARGRLSMRADKSFEFVLDYTGANTAVKCLAPQTGTWEVMDNKILFRRSSKGPSFAYSGAVARGAEWYAYCVKGDSFKYVADHTQPKWVYVRRR